MKHSAVFLLFVFFQLIATTFGNSTDLSNKENLVDAHDVICKAVITPELYIMPDDKCSGKITVLEADITELELKSPLYAEKFFEYFGDKTVSFEVKYSENKVLIHLNDNGKKDLDAWRSFFKTKIEAQRKKSGIVDFRMNITVE